MPQQVLILKRRSSYVGNKKKVKQSCNEREFDSLVKDEESGVYTWIA
jgi:hypothetical protein